MKNHSIKLLAFFLFIASFESFGQEFLGIKIEGNLNEIIAKFKQKGFKVIPPVENSVLLEGKAGTSNVEIVAFASPISKTVYKLNVYLPKKTSWSNLKSEYQDYLSTLTNKYGQPTDSFDFFESPYKEGEGDEMIAVEMEKCHYSAFWTNVSIHISEFKQIRISYENLKNIEIRKYEDTKLKKDIF